MTFAEYEAKCKMVQALMYCTVIWMKWLLILWCGTRLIG